MSLILIDKKPFLITHRVNVRRIETFAELESVFLILKMMLTHVNVQQITMVVIVNVGC